MNKRRSIYDRVGVIDVTYGERITDIIEKLSDAVKEYGDTIVSEEGFLDSNYILLTRPREENDTEYTKRIAREEKNLDKQRQRDIIEFHRLKKKLGDIL